MPTKRSGSEARLEHLAEHVKEVHVEEQVQQAGVQEATGDQPVALAVGDADLLAGVEPAAAEQRAVDEDARLVALDPSEPEPNDASTLIAIST